MQSLTRAKLNVHAGRKFPPLVEINETLTPDFAVLQNG